MKNNTLVLLATLLAISLGGSASAARNTKDVVIEADTCP